MKALFTLALAVTVIGQPAEKLSQVPQTDKRSDGFDSLRPASKAEAARARFFDDDRREKLLDLLAKGTFPGNGPEESTPFPREPEYIPYLRDRVCESAAVVVGQALNSRARFNARETFLFTEFDFLVDSWVRPTKPQGSHIVVATGGGEAVINGTRLRALSFGEEFRLRSEYVLFLKAIPDGDAFVPYGGVRVVDFPEGKVRVLAHQPQPRQMLAQSKANFIADLVNVSGTCTK